MNDPLKSPSYMDIRLDLEGEDALYLRVPTFWDDIGKRWIGAIKTPITKRLIGGEGKDSFNLQNSFNVNLEKAFRSDICDEVFNMFKPKGYWEKTE